MNRIRRQLHKAHVVNWLKNGSDKTQKNTNFFFFLIALSGGGNTWDALLLDDQKIKKKSVTIDRIFYAFPVHMMQYP